MANYKTGFIYYSVETDRYQDMRIKRLKREFKCNGIAIYDYILCEIYRTNGYFLEWNEDMLFDVSDYFNLDETPIQNIINYCADLGLFDKNILDTKKTLTSPSIQRRFVEWSKKAKRVNFHIKDDISLIKEDYSIIKGQTSGIMEKTSGSLKQSKVKENKVKESISIKQREIFEIFYFKNFKNPEKELKRFTLHYKKTGGNDKNGNAVQNFPAAAELWKPEDVGIRTEGKLLSQL